MYYDEYPATVAALNQDDLHAEVTGYITGIYFKDGQRVKKGQRLYGYRSSAIRGKFGPGGR